MEQGGKDGDSNDQNQNQQQPRRSKGVENHQGVAPHQPPPPQKCPRCESLNTKFCYYNNYNLAQPRYFCKGCRRYWTHGGTLRNVPVGGGCRKGRKGRVSPISCGGESSRSRPPRPPQLPPPSQQQQPPPPLVDFPTISSMAALVSGIANLPASSQQSQLGTISWAQPAIYPGGIFAAFEGMQLPPLRGPSQGIYRPLRIGGGTNANAGANMPMFQGFDFSSVKSQQGQSPPFQTRHQPHQPDAVGNRNKDKQPMYTPDDENMVLAAGSMNSWTPAAGDSTSNISTTSSSNFLTNTNGASTSCVLTDQSSLKPNIQWPNFPDYDDIE